MSVLLTLLIGFANCGNIARDLRADEKIEDSPRCRIKFLPTADQQKVSMRIKDGNLLEFAKLMAKTRGSGRFPLRWPEFDDVLENDEEFELLSDQKVTIDLKDVPAWEASARIARELNIGISNHFPFPEFNDFEEPFDWWATVGPMLLTFRLNVPDDQDQKEEITLIGHVHHMPGDVCKFDGFLHGVKLLSEDTTRHDVKLVDVTNAFGEWHSKGKLPLPASKISGIEGNVVTRIAKHQVQLTVRPGEHTYVDNLHKIQVAISDVRVQNVVEVDGTQFEPSQGRDRMYYFRIEMTWPNGLSEKDRREIGKNLAIGENLPSDGSERDENLKALMRSQILLEDKVRYEFVMNRNDSPTEEAIAQYKDNGKGFARFATKCKCLVRESQGKLVLHMFSDDKTKIETRHEILFARDALLISPFRTNRKRVVEPAK